MNVKLLSSEIPNLLPSLDRSPGLHHSEILNSLCVKYGIYKESDFNAPGVMTRMQLGLAFEDILYDRLRRHYQGQYFKPGELIIGDVPITLDLYHSAFNRPEEVKLTWLSSAHHPLGDKFLKYRWQVMSQCLATEDSIGGLHVNHINGDYKGYSPQYNFWEYEFTSKELRDHEAFILNHRDEMLRKGYI